MKFLRVLIEGWTSSFRYPSFISGFQPTLPVPPLSTIYGLLSAIKGDIIKPDDLKIGYIFNYESKTIDLEQIYEIKALTGNKTNVIKREFLVNPKMYLYINDLDFKKYLESPYYQLLLGRSSDLAMIKDIKTVKLEKKSNVLLGKTILPFGTKGAYGILQALPISFSDEIPRKTLETKPFILMDEYFEYEDECYYDKQLDKGIWIW
ncbi:MAG: type I-B CRISPR-associated protein Cas5 [Methanosphaera stadtmanae]|nr:type I-B CRISPR-associated protein Cas5 [Methanosphaera stadtmanae]